MDPDARRTAVLLLSCALMLAAVAVPAAADHGESHGGGQGKSGDNGGGQGNGKGNSGQGSAGGNGNAGGSENAGGQARADSGSEASSDASGNPGQGSAGGNGNARGQGSDRPHPGGDGPSPGPTQGPPTRSEAQALAPEGDGDGPEGSSRGSGDTWHEFVGFVVEQTDAAGGFIEAVQSREDFAQLLSTDMDAPVVSAAMVLLSGFVLLGLYGAVRMDNGAAVGRLKTAIIRKEDPQVYQEEALAAGLPEGRWTGLDAASYRKLKRLDPAAVAFWMKSDVAAVERWQAGRTLEQDIAEGIAVPQKTGGEDEWAVPKARRPVVAKKAIEPVPTES